MDTEDGSSYIKVCFWETKQTLCLVSAAAANGLNLEPRLLCQNPRESPRERVATANSYHQASTFSKRGSGNNRKHSAGRFSRERFSANLHLKRCLRGRSTIPRLWTTNHKTRKAASHPEPTLLSSVALRRAWSVYWTNECTPGKHTRRSYTVELCLFSGSSAATERQKH